MAHASLAPEKVLKMWLVKVLNGITKQYLNNVSEVLGSVQKMEESLRRLKRVRDTKSAAAAGSADEPGGKEEAAAKEAVSDDDKIRLQLYLDVHYFAGSISEKFNISTAEVEDLEELQKVVTEATAKLSDIVEKCF